jgi:DNA-binding LacI/PurR family transcriptional regulator
VTIDGDPERNRAGVTVNQALGAHLATRYLLERGHSTVWHVTGPLEWFDAALRVRGWEQTLRDAGAEVPPVLPADWSAASGYRVGQTIARIPEVTAVFAANDHLALGILRALHEHGKRVPEDLSLVGFDDVPEAGYFIPPLTTVRPDFHAVARHALELLLGQIAAGVSSTAQMMLPPTLIERRSVAAPRA